MYQVLNSTKYLPAISIPTSLADIEVIINKTSQKIKALVKLVFDAALYFPKKIYSYVKPIDPKTTTVLTGKVNENAKKEKAKKTTNSDLAKTSAKPSVLEKENTKNSVDVSASAQEKRTEKMPSLPSEQVNPSSSKTTPSSDATIQNRLLGAATVLSTLFLARFVWVKAFASAGKTATSAAKSAATTGSPLSGINAGTVGAATAVSAGKPEVKTPESQAPMLEVKTPETPIAKPEVESNNKNAS